MIDLLLLAIALFGQVEITNATTFGEHGDRWVGGNAYALGRRINSRDMGIASRTIPTAYCSGRRGPCSGRRATKVLVCSLDGWRCAFGRVLDTGPWGCVSSTGRWHVSRYCRGGRRRGGADLTPALDRAIRPRSQGWGTVVVVPFQFTSSKKMSEWAVRAIRFAGMVFTMIKNQVIEYALNVHKEHGASAWFTITQCRKTLEVSPGAMARAKRVLLVNGILEKKDGRPTRNNPTLIGDRPEGSPGRPPSWWRLNPKKKGEASRTLKAA